MRHLRRKGPKRKFFSKQGFGLILLLTLPRTKENKPFAKGFPRILVMAVFVLEGNGYALIMLTLAGRFLTLGRIALGPFPRDTARFMMPLWSCSLIWPNKNPDNFQVQHHHKFFLGLKLLKKRKLWGTAFQKRSSAPEVTPALNVSEGITCGDNFQRKSGTTLKQVWWPQIFLATILSLTIIKWGIICLSTVAHLKKSIPARNFWKKILQLFSVHVLHSGKSSLTFSPNTSLFLCPATVGSC